MPGCRYVVARRYSIRHHGWMLSFCPFDAFLYALAVCALIIFVLRIRELLGRDIFMSMLFSRYRKPISEERVFLFIDLGGSRRPIAEQAW